MPKHTILEFPAVSVILKFLHGNEHFSIEQRKFRYISNSTKKSLSRTFRLYPIEIIRYTLRKTETNCYVCVQ